MKDIKPGVLSKIMSITEKANAGQHQDDNLKRLITVAKGLEETLFEYANYKPVKKVFTNNGDAKTKEEEDPTKSGKFRTFIENIFEFK